MTSLPPGSLPIGTVSNIAPTLPPSTPILPPTSNSGSTPSMSNDGMNLSSVATSNSGSSDDPKAKTAGFAKRFLNGFTNMIGKVADLAGFGTFAQIAKTQFNKFDTDKDNKINANEFTAVGSLVQKSFQQVDSNTNNEISQGEFKSVVREIVESEFKMTDANQDGFVNFNEANARGMVVGSGHQDSFRRNDANQDDLLSVREFAGMMNELKFNNGNH